MKGINLALKWELLSIEVKTDSATELAWVGVHNYEGEQDID